MISKETRKLVNNLFVILILIFASATIWLAILYMSGIL